MSPTPPHIRALEFLRSRVGPSLSSVVSSAPFRRNVLLGALLSLGVIVFLILAIYLVLLLRGAFGNPAVPYSLGLLVFALLHGGSASVTVPPVPALLDIGGTAVLGLPLTSFALLPFVLLLASVWYLARRTGSGATFALAATLVYAVLVGLLAALGGGSIESGEATIELRAGPFSAFANAFLLAGIATALGVTTAQGPLLSARVRQVVRGALTAVAVSLVLALVLAAMVALLQGISGPAPPTTPEVPPQEAEGGSLRELLSLLGGLVAIAPSALGTLWLLAHGVPVGVQDPSALAGLPLVGQTLADAPLRVSLLGAWPYGFGWRLMLLAPLIGLVAGGAIGAQGAPPADRLRQGAAVALPYTLIVLLVALLARVSADVTLAGASLGVVLGAGLFWILLVLPFAALLGALGGHLSPSGTDATPARPRLAFLATAGACTAVLLLSLPALFGAGQSTGQELLGSAVPGAEAPEPPTLPTGSPREEVSPPETPEPTVPQPRDPAPQGRPEGEQTEVALGEPLVVGEAEWVVANSRKRNELRAQGSEEIRQGDFYVVNFEFTNNSGEPVDLSASSIGLVGKSGRRFEMIPEMARYVPPERDPFSRPVEPGATLEARAIFAVTPKASGFRLQLGDGRPFPPENGYVNLGS